MEDSSLEFDMFEDMRLKLVEVLVAEGRPRIESEKIALYVIQGVREMPKLMTVLADVRSRTHAEVVFALVKVLDNAAALEKAKAMLSGQSESDEEVAQDEQKRIVH